MTEEQKLIKEFEEEHGKRYDTADDAPWAFINWLISKLKSLEDELSDEIKMHSLVIAEKKALQASIDDAPQLYMPKEHLEYAKTKRFPSIDFFATCPTWGTREYIAVALVIKKEKRNDEDVVLLNEDVEFRGFVMSPEVRDYILSLEVLR